ncbi:hypothetical protein [Limnospira platensis]
MEKAPNAPYGRELVRYGADEIAGVGFPLEKAPNAPYGRELVRYGADEIA